MGGRRSYSVRTIIRQGPKIPAQKANLTKALKNEDIIGITRSTSELLTNHNVLAKIITFSSRLTRVILDKHSASEFDSLKTISSTVKKEWSHYKKVNNIEKNKVIDDSVVFSVTKFLNSKR